MIKKLQLFKDDHERSNKASFIKIFITILITHRLTGNL